MSDWEAREYRRALDRFAATRAGQPPQRDRPPLPPGYTYARPNRLWAWIKRTVRR